MIRLILARHGNTFEPGEVATQIGARTDLPLTPQGKKQAEELGNHLKPLAPTVIYAGTLKRQIEFAKILGQHLGSTLKLHEPALTEIDYGAWEGLAPDTIAARWPNEYRNWTEGGVWSASVFGGALQVHLDRIERWLTSLRTTYRDGDSVIGVTSNGLLRFFHPAWKQFAERKQMEALKVKTGHFCELHLEQNDLKAHSWNQNSSNVKPLYI